MMFFCSISCVNSLECVSMNNQECKVRPEIGDFSSNYPIFYPFSIKANKCSDNCNNINDLYARICLRDVVKNLNVKVFNLMSLTNKTRHIEWHERCKCICRLDGIICNNKQRWNEDKCSSECKELIDKGVCDKRLFWNPSNCECEYDRGCDIGEYLDYSNCKCRKNQLIHLLKNVQKILKKQNQLKKLQIKMKQNQLKKLQMKIKIDAVFVQCIECYFGYFSYSL